MSCVSLHRAALDLVRNRPRRLTYVQLAKDLQLNVVTETAITAAWLEQFATGRIKRPDVNKIQPIYEYLSGKKLEIEAKTAQ